jgi:hypothetical protein
MNEPSAGGQQEMLGENNGACMNAVGSLLVGMVVESVTQDNYKEVRRELRIDVVALEGFAIT